MTDFKVGDRVRATKGNNVFEGECHRETGTNLYRGFVIVDGESSAEIWPGDGWTIEKVSPPLPTKVGAIVATSVGLYARLRGVHVNPWVRIAGENHVGLAFSDASLEAGRHIEVIFEGVDQ